MNLIQDLKNGATTIDYLKNELGIKIKEYPQTLYEDGSVCIARNVFNYDQIESPKSHPYVMQSRGLILDGDFNLLCLPFDRFFNFGEVIDHSEIINWDVAQCFEKVDGSLIKIYWDGRQYCIATRGTAFAESPVNGWEITFKDLVLKALNMTNEQFQIKCHFNLAFDKTYLCEITALENRVVTRYDGYTLWHLATRDNNTGEYVESDAIVNIGGKKPNVYGFTNSNDCLNSAASLPDLQEGYVIYQHGQPICKIKSPAYVATHHIKGEGLNPKRIAELVLSNEQDEYLKYFPEDEDHINPYVSRLNELHLEILYALKKSRGIDNQKEFAMNVKDLPYSAVLFQWKKSPEYIIDIWNKQPLNYRRKILLSLVGENE